MNKLGDLFSLSCSNRHYHRRENLRHLINNGTDDHQLMGQICKLKLSELCDPENLDPDRHRLTSFIAAVAPLMCNIQGCKAGRDKGGRRQIESPKRPPR
jgi:hypothetical protein